MSLTIGELCSTVKGMLLSAVDDRLYVIVRGVLRASESDCAGAMRGCFWGRKSFTRRGGGPYILTGILEWIAISFFCDLVALTGIRDG